MRLSGKNFQERRIPQQPEGIPEKNN